MRSRHSTFYTNGRTGAMNIHSYMKLKLLGSTDREHIGLCDIYALHLFADANKSAYSAMCNICTTESTNNKISTMVLCKSGVAPKKETSLDRLEILARLTLVFKNSKRERLKLWQSIKNEQFCNYFTNHHIKWKFIANHAPWWGSYHNRKTSQACQTYVEEMHQKRISHGERATSNIKGTDL